MDEQSAPFQVYPGDVLVIEAEHPDKIAAEKLAAKMCEVFGIEQVLVVQPGAQIRVLRVGVGE
jgi:predicted regulator of Ras-like GTPase activity (Roadblock/LC7/MglB family)